MRYLKLKVALPMLMSATFALNAVADDYYDNAPVIATSPQVERVNMPRQECHQEIVRENYGYSNNSSPAGAIIGGVAGGLLGSTIGKGGGKVAAAAVGAGVGAVVGDRMATNNQPSGTVDRAVDRCVTVDNWHSVNCGYLVTYRYNGRDYTTVTNEMPGSTIRVRIGVNAADNAVYSVTPNPVGYYSAPPTQVIYREPVRVYSAPPPVVFYGSYGGYGGYERHHGWGREEREHHRW